MKSCWITRHEHVESKRTLIRENKFNNHGCPTVLCRVLYTGILLINYKLRHYDNEKHSSTNW